MRGRDNKTMIETEVLVEIYESFAKAQAALGQFEYCGVTKVVDTYYYDPLRNDLKPYKDGKLYASFRIREKAEDTFITYKNDHYARGIWQYSDEFEVKTDDLMTTISIVESLGFKQLLVIESEKHFYRFNDYEMALEVVTGLGIFLEIELKKEVDPSQVTQCKMEIMNFISLLDISVSQELNAGKPELYIQKNNLII